MARSVQRAGNPYEPGDLEELLVETIIRIRRFVLADYSPSAQGNSLTIEQGRALSAMLRGPRSMKEIARQAETSSSAATDMIERLVVRGLAERVTPEDRRQVLVRVTPAGRELLRRTRRHYIERTAGLTGQLSPADRGELRRLLDVLSRTLEQCRDA